MKISALNRAKYLTPLRFDKNIVFGAAYNEEFKLCPDSQRHSKYAYYRPGDPVDISEEILHQPNLKELSGDILYLGNLFSESYGHFLLETLPMIYYLMNDEFIGYKYLFLPWMETCWRMGVVNSELLFNAVRLIGLHSRESEIIIHNEKNTLVGSFYIVPRPMEINHRIVNAEPYKLVIDELKKCSAVKACSDKIDGNDKIFMQVDAKRIAPEYAKIVENVFLTLGFYLIRPEKYTLAEQIALCSKAKYIAGFSGSALHNAIFAGCEAKTIELGDRRSPFKSIRNQTMINEISGAELEFIPYKEKNLKARLKKILSP